MKLWVVAGVLLLAGCSSDADEPDLSGYSPEVQQRIETAVDDGDCTALQAMFDVADGRDDPDLMEYIDTVMRDAGCYD